MDAPPIQYARTDDGVNIAYWTLGEGPPLLHLPPSISNIQQEWDIPPIRSWYERVARHHTLIRFDRRGCGLSDRHVARLDHGSAALDSLAVLDALALDHAPLFVLPSSYPSGRAPGDRLFVWRF